MPAAAHPGVARTLQKLIAPGSEASGARCVSSGRRIEGTLALNGRPDLAGRIRAVVHMDMVVAGRKRRRCST
jgi:hypothetical protein